MWCIFYYICIVKVLWRNITNKIIDTQKRRYWSLHMVIEARKSYDLSSASWRTRKGSNIIQCESKGLRNWGAWGQEPGVGRLRAEKRWKSQVRKKRIFLSVLLFFGGWRRRGLRVGLGKEVNRLDITSPTHVGEGIFFYLVYWFKC